MPCDRMQLCFVLWRPCRLALWNSVGFSHLHTDNRVRMWSHWKQSRCMANCRSRMRKWQEESQGIYFWIAKLSRSQINCRISTLGRSNYIVFFSWKTKFYLWRWESGQKRHRTRRARPKTTLLYVYYLVWYTDLGGRGVFRRLTSLLFKVIRQISRSHGAEIAEFDPDWAFPDCNSSLNSPMAMKWCTKLEVA